MESLVTSLSNPSDGEPRSDEEKPMVVVIMGATGAGKSRLAIDLADYFPIEIINADSMQVYSGLDVLTNKVTLDEQKGVTHHLLGTENPNVEFTAKLFRDSAIPLIDEICSRHHLPVIVGGTNYYIQALLSPFLVDESTNSMDDGSISKALGEEEHPDFQVHYEENNCSCSFDHLKDVDPVAAARIHPNNLRKINQYLNLYAHSGILPSKFYQEKTVEGRIGAVLKILDTTAVLYVWMPLSLFLINMWRKELM